MCNVVLLSIYRISIGSELSKKAYPVNDRYVIEK